MKKFKFSLDTVLSYKQQVLDALEAEHAEIMARVRAQEEVLEAAWVRYRENNEEFRARKAEGMSILDATLFQNGMRSLELNIQRETSKLEALQAAAEAKREEMVAAKIDTSSLEKLKDKKLEAYQKAVQKDEEVLVDEFISAARVASGASA